MRDFEEYNKNPEFAEEFEEQSGLGAMGLFDHLEDLRWCIGRCFIALIICFPLGMIFVDDFITFCTQLSKVESFAAFNPAENFLQRFRVAFLLSLFVCLPYVLMQIWAFISPGLYDKERRWTGYSVLASYLLFATGAAFGLFIISPMALDFFHGLQTETVRNVLRLSETISFVTRISVAMGIVLQLPVIVVLLSLLNIVELETIKKSRSYVWAGMFILAAVLTPPDVISQVMLAVPTIILFELALLLCHFMETDPVVREKNKKRNLTIAVTALLTIFLASSFGIYRVYQLKSGQLFEQSFASVSTEQLPELASNDTGQKQLETILDYHIKEDVTIPDERWQELLKLWQDQLLSDTLKQKMLNYAFALRLEVLHNLEGRKKLNLHIEQRAHVPIKLQALWQVKIGEKAYFWPGLNNQYRYDQSLEVLEKISRLDVMTALPRFKLALSSVGDHQVSFGLKVTQAQDLTSNENILWLDELNSAVKQWQISTAKQ